MGIEPTNFRSLGGHIIHYTTATDGIPYSQAKRYRRIISDDNSFKSSLQDLKHHFKQRDYPEKIIDCAFEEDALQSCNKAKTKVIPFTVEYNPSLPNIGAAINKYWDLLNLSQKEEVKIRWTNHATDYRSEDRALDPWTRCLTCDEMCHEILSTVTPIFRLK
ncbi:hypothetical protein DPMN_037474 [Dreissena polymorpha]|uniref:Helix-turn-helix domain-containing protein n=1 Tax=Dreissena polymorpha TaxID=45954 RepID=A0A9D4RPW2_DREPO|nr:hypothetical protein DPMN_037474 [Dreissena polymorpha]